MRHKTVSTIKVPAIGQGTQGIYDSNIIRRGIDLGMALIDTAEVYNNEILVGQAIKGIRDKVFISTKFSPEHTDNIINACEGSLKRLGIDYIDLYQLHWRMPTIPLEQTIRALQELQKAGKVRNVGVCNMFHKEVEGLDISSIQVEYNLLDRTAEELFVHCGKHDILMIAYSPLADLYKLPPSRMVWFQEIAFKYGKTLSQLALNWIISHNNVVAIPKSSDPIHQQLNATSDFVLPLEEYEKIDKLFTFEVNYIDPKQIKITRVGKFPQTLEEAKQNITYFIPSPIELAQDLEDIKPIKVSLLNEGYELEEGGLRYWAWVIKYGEKPIPTLIKELRGTDL